MTWNWPFFSSDISTILSFDEYKFLYSEYNVQFLFQLEFILKCLVVLKHCKKIMECYSENCFPNYILRHVFKNWPYPEFLKSSYLYQFILFKLAEKNLQITCFILYFSQCVLCIWTQWEFFRDFWKFDFLYKTSFEIHILIYVITFHYFDENIMFSKLIHANCIFSILECPSQESSK